MCLFCILVRQNSLLHCQNCFWTCHSGLTPDTERAECATAREVRGWQVPNLNRFSVIRLTKVAHCADHAQPFVPWVSSPPASPHEIPSRRREHLWRRRQLLIQVTHRRKHCSTVGLIVRVCWYVCLRQAPFGTKARMPDYPRSASRIRPTRKLTGQPFRRIAEGMIVGLVVLHPASQGFVEGRCLCAVPAASDLGCPDPLDRP